ncbi:MAG: glycosyltransferase family 39 protein [Bacteroidia bacterium]
MELTQQRSTGFLGMEGRFWDWVLAKKAWIALAIFLVNIALKLPFLGGSSLFLDEAVAIYETQDGVGKTIEFSANDPTPPLFYLVLSVWTQIFGISEASARFPSMIFSSITAALIFLLGCKHFGSRAGLYSSLLFTCSAIGMVFAHEARSYALAGMLTTMSYFLFLNHAADDKVIYKRLGLLVLVNALLLLTHYLTSMAVAAQAVVSVWMLRGKVKHFLTYAGSQVIVLGLWLPWVAYNRSLLSDSKVTSWLKPPDAGVLDYVLINFAGSKFLKWLAFGMIVAGLLVGIVMLIRRKNLKGGYAFVVALAWFALAMTFQYVVAKAVMPVFELRYTMYALPGALLLVGAAVSWLPVQGWLRNAVFLVALVPTVQLLDLNPQKVENWRDAVAMAKEIQTPGSVIISWPYYQYPSFAYYYDREIFQQWGETTKILGEKNIRFGDVSGVVPKIDGTKVTNVIILSSQESIAGNSKGIIEGLRTEYCVARRGAFKGIKVFQFQLSPCKPDPGGYFLNDFEKEPLPDEKDRIKLSPDSLNPQNHVTFVGPGHEFSATIKKKAGDAYGGRFSAAELRVQGKLMDEGKKVVLVYVMNHGNEAYNWTGFELQQNHHAGEFFKESFQVLVPEVKSVEDEVSLYLWSPDGGAAEFDSLSIDFWEGD